MLGLPRFQHRLYGFALVLIAAACAVPLPSARVEAPVPATSAPAAVAATPPPATLPPSAPAPATLATAIIASQWEEATGTSSLLALDPLTGQPLPGYAPIPLGQGFASARSPNGRWLATVNYEDQACDAWAGGSRCQPSDGALHLIDLPAWRDTPTPVRAGSNASFIVFSRDSRWLAIGQSAWPDHGVLLVDTATGALAAETALDFYPQQAAFSAGGQQLMLYGLHYTHSQGFNPQPRVAVLDTASLSVQWQAPLPAVLDGQYVPDGAQNIHDESVWWTPAAVFAPDAQRLYLVHADADTLTTVDFAARSISAVAVGPAQSWLDRLMALTAGVAEAKMLNGTEKHAVLSADGQRLYVVGAHVDTRDGQYTRTPLGLRVIETDTGVLLNTLDTPAGFIQLAPGEGRFFLTNWEAGPDTELRAMDDLRALEQLSGVELQAASLINGQPVVFALSQSRASLSVRVLDAHTLAEAAQWVLPSAFWLLP